MSECGFGVTEDEENLMDNDIKTSAINILTYYKMGQLDEARKLLYESDLDRPSMIKVWELLDVDSRSAIKGLQEAKVNDFDVHFLT
jgi:hypothetical protein